jgi:hypothetical protein
MKIHDKVVEEQFRNGQSCIKINSRQELDELAEYFNDIEQSHKEFNSLYDYAHIINYSSGDKRLCCFSGNRNRTVHDSLDSFCTLELEHYKTLEVPVVYSFNKDSKNINCSVSQNHIQIGIYKFKREEFEKFVKESL